MNHVSKHDKRPVRPRGSLGLPKWIFTAVRRQQPPIRVDQAVVEAASLSAEEMYQRLDSRRIVTGEAFRALSSLRSIGILYCIGLDKRATLDIFRARSCTRRRYQTLEGKPFLLKYER